MDLFENYELLPGNVLEVLTEFEEMDETYENCENFRNQLENIGYTFDYYLDAIPYDLRKIKQIIKEKKECKNLHKKKKRIKFTIIKYL